MRARRSCGRPTKVAVPSHAGRAAPPYHGGVSQPRRRSAVRNSSRARGCAGSSRPCPGDCRNRRARAPRSRLLGQPAHVHVERDLLALVDHRPALRVPAHRRQEGLTPEVLPVKAPLRAEGEEHHPPVSFAVLHQVGVPGPLDRLTERRVAVGEDRVARARLERPPGRAGARHRHHVPVLRIPLGDHEVVAPGDLVEVRPLRIAAARPFPDDARRRVSCLPDVTSICAW